MTDSTFKRFSDPEIAAVYRAIRERSPESARNAMRDHLMLAQKAQETEEVQ